MKKEIKKQNELLITKCKRQVKQGLPWVKNPPSNAGDAGSIPGQETKIPHVVGQLKPLCVQQLLRSQVPTRKKSTHCNN